MPAGGGGSMARPTNPVRRVRAGAALTLLVALITGGFLWGIAPAHASAQSAPPCPVSEAPNGVDVCVDRGEGALYAEGDAIRICVTVNIPTILIFPPPPPPLVRLTNTVDGAAPRVLL